MIRWNSIPMGPKLIGLFLLVGLVPLLLVSWVAKDNASTTLMKNSFKHLESIREIKKRQIQNYIEERWHDIRGLASISETMRDEAFKKLETIESNKRQEIEQLFKLFDGQLHSVKDDPYSQQALVDFNQAFVKNSHTVKNQAWKAALKQYQPRLFDISRDNGWTDLLLINPQGDVVFSVLENNDLGLNIPKSTLQTTSLGKAWQSIQTHSGGHAILTDFFPYPPLDNQQAAFMISPTYDTTHSKGNLLGYVAFPILKDSINHILRQRAGLGNSGEVYLVGMVEGVSLYRSDRITKEGIFGSQRSDSYTQKALNGKTGSTLKIGSTGVVELVRYSPLQIQGLNWAIMATIEAQEAITPTSKNNNLKDLFSQYVKEKGYYDLFLIDSRGTLFYSVNEEIDHQTNLVNGPYAHSNFGQLVQKILKTKAPGISDFAPYAPSGGAQSAFLVQPIFQNNTIELMVALKLSHHQLDQIMNQRDGMGKTGETFLIGTQDKHSSFRSSRQIKKGEMGHNVPEYLATIAQEEHSGTNITVDDDGGEMLISHAPLDIPSLNWSILAAMNVSEVKAPVQTLLMTLLWVVLVLAVIVVVLALLTARTMITPIQNLMETTKKIVGGDWSARVDVQGSDEIGKLGTIFNQMTGYTEEQYWLQSSLAQFSEIIQKSGSPKELAQQLVGQLADLLEVGHGAVYVLDTESHRYTLLGSFAYSERKNLSNSFAEGEGLVGQCALERKTILLRNAPDNYITIHSGLGEAKPLTILAVPVLFQNMVLAVVELASFNPISSIQRSLLEKLTTMVGLGLENQFRSKRTQELLTQTQAQAEEMASQQEALKKSNEELHQQAQALKASEEELHQSNEELQQQTQQLQASEVELRTQQEELQTSNDQLTEKSEILKKNQEVLEEARQEIEDKAKALETTSRYKSEFLANMSHELRTPLNSLLILAKNLTENDEGNLNLEQIEAAKIIHGSGQDLLSLINDILDLSKIEAGKLDIYLEDVDIQDFSDEMRSSFSHMATDKGLKLVVEVSEDTPKTIRTDVGKIKQILKNFLSNAFKFSENGQVVLAFKPPPQDRRIASNEYRIVNGKGNNAIALEVTDSGIGISKDKLSLVFEAFQQADGSTSRNYGGTGLGLSISREMAKLLGGELRVQSLEGQGSTFTLLLPKNLQEIPQETIDPPPPEKQIRRKSDNEATLIATRPIKPTPCPTSPDDRNNLRPSDHLLLIIDNDPNFAALACLVSHTKGFKCLIATDGKTGLDLARKHQPCGIILGLEIPGLDGMTLLLQLKEEADTRSIPVYLTSSLDPDMEALQKGAMGHLNKPVQKEAFEEVFEKIRHLSGTGKRRILLVEDDKLTRNLIADLLHIDLAEVTAVGTGEEATNLLKQKLFDCMVLDLGLPDISGFDLLERITRSEEIPHLPVIVYTGKDLSREEQEQLHCFSDSIVIKGAHSEERLLDEVTLFLHSATEQLSSKQQAMIQKIRDPKLLFKDKTVLVVDDDMRNAFALKRVLRLKGLQVLIAANGKKALGLMNEHPDIDVVLMDIMMPEMDGYETMQEIRKQKRFQTLPILALSAKAMIEDRKKCLKAGANDFLPKPVDMDRLLAMLRLWLYR